MTTSSPRPPVRRPRADTATHVVKRAGADGKLRDMPLVDFGGKHLMNTNPVAVQRILGLARAGHSYRYVLEVGTYQGSWDAAFLDAVLAAHRIELHGTQLAKQLPPDARPLPCNDYEYGVLRGIVDGHTNAEIAESLALPVERIRSTASTLASRAGCRDRIGLIVAVLTGKALPCNEGDHDRTLRSTRTG